MSHTRICTLSLSVSMFALISLAGCQKASADPPAADEPTEATTAVQGDPGWSFDAPADWTVKRHDGRVYLFEANKEIVIAVEFKAGATLAMLEAQLRAESGDRSRGLKAVSRPRRVGGTLVMSLEKQEPWGQAVARLSAVAGNGGALVALGFAKPDGAHEMVTVVGAITASARFGGAGKATQAPPKSTPRTLVGHWTRWSGRGGRTSISRSSALTLCPDGTFRDSYQSSVSMRAPTGRPNGPRGGSYSDGKGAGRWTTSGGDQRGTITLRYSNGRTRNMSYQVLSGKRYCTRFGCDVAFGRKWHGREGVKNRCR